MVIIRPSFALSPFDFTFGSLAQICGLFKDESKICDEIKMSSKEEAR